MLSMFFLAVAAAPVAGVDSISLEGTQSAVMDMSFINLFLQADAVVKTVMLLLFFASVWSWAIIFDKIILYKSIRSKSHIFEKDFWSGQSLENFFERIKGRENHPLAVVFTAAMQEWQARNVKDLTARHELRAGTKERVHAAMQVASSKSLDKMEKSLSFLATVGSAAPFIGLFGTVWGIMISFQSIAISKNTTLAVVAPGIAEALLATALGLAAAIPAMIFYNKFANELNRTANSIDDFSNELSAIISRELDNIK